MEKVAVVCARGLGDALLSMILSHNLALSGIEVTTFSSILCELREWFPNQTILPFPSSLDIFTSFDRVIAADHSLIKEKVLGSHLILLKERNFNKTLSMADNLQRVCKTGLALPYSEKSNGIFPPHSLTWRAYPRRVVIHPMSTDPKKNWPANKYVQLGKELLNEGYQPVYCVSPTEREEWLARVPERQLPLFKTIDALACFVYESGSMIGNDSGIGHLASALNIPTLSLFARKSYSNLWRPGWGMGDVVTPPNFLPGSRLKQKYWKEILLVSRVRRAFKSMGVER